MCDGPVSEWSPRRYLVPLPLPIMVPTAEGPCWTSAVELTAMRVSPSGVISFRGEILITGRMVGPALVAVDPPARAFLTQDDLARRVELPPPGTN